MTLFKVMPPKEPLPPGLYIYVGIGAGEKHRYEGPFDSDEARRARAISIRKEYGDIAPLMCGIDVRPDELMDVELYSFSSSLTYVGKITEVTEVKNDGQDKLK